MSYSAHHPFASLDFVKMMRLSLFCLELGKTTSYELDSPSYVFKILYIYFANFPAFLSHFLVRPVTRQMRFPAQLGLILSGLGSIMALLIDLDLVWKAISSISHKIRRNLRAAQQFGPNSEQGVGSKPHHDSKCFDQQPYLASTRLDSLAKSSGKKYLDTVFVLWLSA